MKATFDPATGKYSPDFDPATREYLEAMEAARTAVLAQLATKYKMTTTEIEAHIQQAVDDGVQAVLGAARTDGRIPR